jgi:hypothetical protein
MQGGVYVVLGTQIPWTLDTKCHGCSLVTEAARIFPGGPCCRGECKCPRLPGSCWSSMIEYKGLLADLGRQVPYPQGLSRASPGDCMVVVRQDSSGKLRQEINTVLVNSLGKSTQALFSLL